MKRRLAAAILAFALAACEGEAPERAPAPSPRPVAVAAAPAYVPAKSPTLAAVRRRGWLACGVHPGLPGFAYPDARRVWRGFDVDICRALAAATLGDANKVRFTPVDAADRFGALRAGRIDVLARNTSWTFARDAGLGLDFASVTYYDGQGFLAPRSLGVTSAEELSGARVCVQAGTASDGNLIDWFGGRGVRYQPVSTRSEIEARQLYEAEACDVFSADISALAATRSALNNPNGHMILPEVISKEPLGPVVRSADPAWSDIVRWTVHAMVLGEEFGLTSRTVDEARSAPASPDVERLLGLEGDLGPLLGLAPDWGFQVIRQVGSYGEVFDRNLGPRSALRLERGLNALWNASRPGLMYAPPMR
ncbi:amino acid ABC transporter substrate-binding protein [Phenylobacterium sp.]|jgi:general L-amino acid transport system substrate-binding protein|uniref:amino acid ABC transporter substrate-binding protein n=1 Tax=Phenylobacterium sp. TaxID=1871053 RepID=UPI0037845785